MIDRAATIRDESDRFAAALADVQPDAAVPTCPGWTARDLLQHLVQVHQFWAAVIGERLEGEAVGAFESSQPALPSETEQLLRLRAEATQALVAALSQRDAAETAWSWFESDQTVGFTWRMQTHEATMHRVDAELTAGLPISPIAADVAAEGVDHIVDVMWNWTPNDAERRVTATIKLVASDTGQEWLIDVHRWTGEAWGRRFTDQPGGMRSVGGHPTATVTGTAAALDLLLWNRLQGVEASGDEQALSELDALLAVGVQ